MPQAARSSDLRTITIADWLEIQAYQEPQAAQCTEPSRSFFEMRGRAVVGQTPAEPFQIFRLSPQQALDSMLGAIVAMERLSGEGWVRPAVPQVDLPMLRDNWRAFAREPMLSMVGVPPLDAHISGALREILRPGDPGYDPAVSQLQYVASRLESNDAWGQQVPGGLVEVTLADGQRVYFVGDVHGNILGLLDLLSRRVDNGLSLLQSIRVRGDKLFVLGDFYLPFVSRWESPYAGAHRAIYAIDVFARLQNMLGDNFAIVRGNHDGVFGAIDQATGGLRAEILRQELMRLRGGDFLWALQAFVDRLPLIINVKDADKVVATAGHTPVARMTRAQAITSPFYPRRLFELTFGRLDPTYLMQNMGAARAMMGARGSVFVAGHRGIPPGMAGSAYQPLPGIVILQAHGPDISGVTVAKNDGRTTVMVENFAGDASSPLAGRDLRDSTTPEPMIAGRESRNYSFLGDTPLIEFASDADAMRARAEFRYAWNGFADWMAEFAPESAFGQGLIGNTVLFGASQVIANGIERTTGWKVGDTEEMIIFGGLAIGSEAFAAWAMRQGFSWSGALGNFARGGMFAIVPFGLANAGLAKLGLDTDTWYGGLATVTTGTALATVGQQARAAYAVTAARTAYAAEANAAMNTARAAERGLAWWEEAEVMAARAGRLGMRGLRFAASETLPGLIFFTAADGISTAIENPEAVSDGLDKFCGAVTWTANTLVDGAAGLIDTGSYILSGQFIPDAVGAVEEFSDTHEACFDELDCYLPWTW